MGNNIRSTPISNVANDRIESELTGKSESKFEIILYLYVRNCE